LIGSGVQNFGAGLVFLGGLMGGMISVTIYIYNNKIKWLQAADWAAPFLALGHGIGRIGCFLVGDDYGIPSNLPWACSFPNGLPPIDVPVHPTQIYEMAAYFSVFIYLRYRKGNQNFRGELMFEYLFLVGFSRFMIDFIRNNPKYLMGFSGAQYISILMIMIGAYQMWKMRRIVPHLVRTYHYHKDRYILCTGKSHQIFRIISYKINHKTGKTD
jgi:phosphatidylglycerol:prolipoprotein diacylglycerol transferase